jgi:hypothetical protein
MDTYHICPNCKKEEYFFDGEKLKCPNCNQKQFEIALHISEGNQNFQSLAELNQPYFYLNCGEIYTCIVEYNQRIENTTILPVVYASDSNKLFFIFEAEKIFKQMPKMINELFSNTFLEILTLKINFDLGDEIGHLIVLGASEKDNSIIEYNGYVFKNFIKINSR